MNLYHSSRTAEPLCLVGAADKEKLRSNRSQRSFGRDGGEIARFREAIFYIA
jgi:hypothetical protein